MVVLTGPSFSEAVNGQIELLQSGKPLEAIDHYFASDGVMFANGKLFAQGAETARKKQEPYISSAKNIVGNIVDLNANESAQICVFRNKSRFTDEAGNKHQIDGLCWQQWSDGKISEEQYFQGDMMVQMISDGLLDNPERHKPLKKVKPRSDGDVEKNEKV